MSRALRIEYPDAIYHVTARGNRQEPIFVDDVDRWRFFEILATAMFRFDARVLAHCLMGNHFHLVVCTRRANLAQLMRHVNGVYAQAFNRRHGKVGHLYQGRYHAVLVQADAYLLELCRYVDLNPVRAGFASSPDGWGWSSYRPLTGQDRAPPWLDTARTLGHVLGRDLGDEQDRLEAFDAYAALVASAADAHRWKLGLHGGIFLGDEAFVAQARLRDVRRARQPDGAPIVHRVDAHRRRFLGLALRRHHVAAHCPDEADAGRTSRIASRQKVLASDQADAMRQLPTGTRSDVRSPARPSPVENDEPPDIVLCCDTGDPRSAPRPGRARRRRPRYRR